jgi:nitrous oxidase accessory protein NosD
LKRTVLTLTLVTVLLLSAIAGALFVKPVSARTLTVPDDYSTIQGAIDAANDGDTVFVKSGYYPETLFINKSMSLIGEDKEHTIIDAQKRYTVVRIMESGVTFTDFTFGNTKVPSSSGDIIRGIDIGNYVTNCYIANNRLVSIFGSAFWIPWTASNNTIKNNVLINCSQLVAFLGPNDNNIIEGNEEVNLTNVPSPFPSPSPSPEPTSSLEPTSTPTSTPYQEPQQTEQLEIIIVAAIAIVVIGAGLGLLIYLIKRK